MANRRIRTRNRGLLTVVLSFIAVGYYLLSIDNKRLTSPTPINIAGSENAPIAMVTGLTVRRYTNEGSLHYKLETARADRFKGRVKHDAMGDSGAQPSMPLGLQEELNLALEKNSFDGDFDAPHLSSDSAVDKLEYSRLLKPKFTVFKSGNATTHITSNTAYVTDHNTVMELIGQVRVHDQSNNMKLTSDAMTLNTELNQILSNSAVKVITPTSTTHARGMQGNLVDQRWQLMSEVRSVVQP